MEAEDIADQVKVAKAARDEAQSALNELEPVENVLVIHPGAIKKFSDQIKALRDHAAEMVGEDATEAAKAIRALIDKIIVHPHPEKKGGVRLEIQGRLNHLLTPKALPKGPGGGLVVPMVAEEGFEPPTQGL